MRKNWIRLFGALLAGAMRLGLTACGSKRKTKEVEGVFMGVDVAKYQGTIDWQALAGAGTKFAMVRLGYRTAGEGTIVEDSNARYAEPVNKAEKPKEPPVYIGENDQIKDYTRFVFGRFPVEDVKAAGKKYGLTITEYLCVAMILMFIKCSPEPVSLPIKISVPVDLRRRFPSDSVRNFVFMTDVTFNPQGRTDVTFEDIADSVRGMAAAGATPEKLRAAVSTNVAAERNPITSAVPYPVKKAVMKQSYLDMQYSYTTILSNLGEIKFPPEIAPLVLEADCCLNKTPFLHFGCAAVSLNGIFNLTFTSANTNTEREKFFFRLLSSHGIRVRVDSTEQA